MRYRALLNVVGKVHPDATVGNEALEDEEAGEVETERSFFLVIREA